jgi:Tfp pilus assembly protein PilV
MSQRQPQERGFTLVSVLIAVVLLTFGLMALARTQSILVATQGTLATRSTALAIAQGYTEVIRSRDPATLATEAAVDVDEQGQPSVQGKFSRSTVVTNDATNLLRVTVRVDYPRERMPIELVTLIFRRTP